MFYTKNLLSDFDKEAEDDNSLDTMPPLVYRNGGSSTSSESNAEDLDDEWMNASIGTFDAKCPDWGMPDMAPDIDKESEEIEGIIGHRCRNKKQMRIPEALIKWTSGKETWEPLIHVKKDVPVIAAK